MVVVNFWLGLKLNPDSQEFAALIAGMPDEIAREIAETGFCAIEGRLVQYFQCQGTIVGFGLSLATHDQSSGPGEMSSSFLSLAESGRPWMDKLLWDWGLRRGSRGYRSKVWFQSDQAGAHAEEQLPDLRNELPTRFLN